MNQTYLWPDIGGDVLVCCWIHLVDAWSGSKICRTVGIHSCVKDGFLEQNTMWSCHAMIVRVFRLACSKWNFFGQKRWSFFFWDTLHQNSMKHAYIDIQAFTISFVGFEASKWNYEWLFYIVHPAYFSYVLACCRILWWLQWSNTLQPSPLGDSMVIYLHDGSEGWLLISVLLVCFGQGEKEF